MSRQVYRFVILLAIMGIAWMLNLPDPAKPTTHDSVSIENRALTPTSKAHHGWGRPETLDDHFARHGRDFNARDADDHAAQAEAFLQRAKIAGFPAKRDTDGTIRVFDGTTGAFGAYRTNGTTRTYFKPTSRDYFERQPGVRIDLRTAR